jgi:FAD dependent oxidoreductase
MFQLNQKIKNELYFAFVLFMIIVFSISSINIFTTAQVAVDVTALEKNLFTPITYQNITTPTISGKKVECEVIINGGAMAALFAGIASAKEGVNTCLIEPTDWVGGQLTASGVPAIDWQWMSDSQGVNVKDAHKLRENATFLFWDWMNQIGNPGKCTVSRNCFLPTKVLEEKIKPYLATIPNLKIYYNSVVKSVDSVKVGTAYDTYTGTEKDVNQVSIINAVQRTPFPNLAYNGYDKRLSEDMKDWYDTINSPRFTKEVLNFTGVAGKLPIVVEASEFSDVMVLSGAEYLQGAQTFDGSTVTSKEQCGQGITHTFNMKSYTSAQAENAPDKATIPRTTGVFNSAPYGYDGVWRYRRLLGGNTVGQEAKLLPNETTVMNWRSQDPNNGNDYGAKYAFKTYADTKAEKVDWQGGIDYSVLKGAEDLSYDFYYWFKEQNPYGTGNNLILDPVSTQTSTGLYKMPYFRDIRRSVGIDNFLLKTSELDMKKPTGYRFEDRVALTSYPFDIHPTENCTFSNDDQGLNDVLGKKEEPLAFYVPFRSLTNRSTSNMLVAGKSIAQSLKAGAGTRLQPGEASTGTAAGVSAAYMVKKGLTNVYDIAMPKAPSTYSTVISEIQTAIKKYQNIDWTIAGVKYPSANENLKKVRFMYFCPTETIPDLAEGYCVGANDAYGPFSEKMEQDCIANKGGTVCTDLKTFQVNDLSISATRYAKKFARALRKTDECLSGTVKDSILTDFCVQTNSGGVKQIFGPFTYGDIKQCRLKGGGNSCFANRYSYNFIKDVLGK